MNNTAKVLVAFAAGAVAGAVAGLLLAPAKGADTRRKIVETGKKMSEKVNDTLASYKKEFSKDFVNGEES